MFPSQHFTIPSLLSALCVAVDADKLFRVGHSALGLLLIMPDDIYKSAPVSSFLIVFATFFLLVIVNVSMYLLYCNSEGTSLANSVIDADVLQCTDHMCPLRVHWHIKNNYVDHWRVKMTISNYNYGKNYSNWNVLVQHPSFGQPSTSYSFNSTVLPSLGASGTFSCQCLSKFSSWDNTQLWSSW